MLSYIYMENILLETLLLTNFLFQTMVPVLNLQFNISWLRLF